MLVKEIDKQTAEVKFYGDVGGWFVNGDTFSSLFDELEAKGYKNVIIRMHCYGGSVIEGNVIYNMIHRSSLNISVDIVGIAASMACMILPSLSDVSIADNGFGMIHRPTGTDSGNADSHLQTAKILQDMEDNFVKRLSERTGMNPDDVKSKWFDGQDHWLNADEMVQYGFANKKVPATAKNIRVLDTEINGLTVDSIYNRFAAKLIINTQTKIQMNPLVTLLVAAFQLEGITSESSEADVVAALTNKFSSLNTRIASLESDAKAKLDASIAGIISAAGVTDEKQIATFKSIGEKAGVEALAAVLPKQPGGIVQQPDLTSFVKTDSVVASVASVVKDWDWYQEHDYKTLEALEKSGKATFNALYKAKFGVEPN